MRRTTVLLALAAALVLPATPVVAQEAATTETTVAGGATTETTLVYKTPAVSLVETPPEEVVQPWTIRYLVPTTIAIAAILVILTVIQYFLKVVRTRYKTVE
jgi:phosphatidylglycerophosphate synthase